MIYCKHIPKIFWLLGLAACTTHGTVTEDQPLSLHWEIVASPYGDTQRTLSRLTITNRSPDTLSATGWSVFFNAGEVEVFGNDTLVAAIEIVNGDFFALYPKEKWKPVPPDSSVRIQVLSRKLNNVTDIPKGFYWVSDSYPGGVPVPLEVAPFASADGHEIALAARVHTQNELIYAAPGKPLPPIIPTPNAFVTGESIFRLGPEVAIAADRVFRREAGYLRDELAGVLIQQPVFVEDHSAASITLRHKEGLPPEGYVLVVDSHGIVIEASKPAGAFYGVQSLKGLLPPVAWQTKQTGMALTAITINDAPRFGHRAVMLDVARNFQTKEQVMKIIDLLALYKINVLHFHLNEDEAWRLEIPGLPELTEVGAKRGHTLDDATHLMPSYGSGPYVDNATGTGHYSRSEYIELLEYATERHIRVIPEIETPGHARAAIKSMDARYARLLAEGDTAAATRYLLRDVDDQSVYRSVQNWNDNVMNIALPSTYAFLEMVVDELIAMYHEAGAPLQTIHFGGDEVPNGVWERSPAVHRLLTSEGIPHVDELWHYYFSRIDGMLKSRGLYLSGWEEIGMKQAEVNGARRMVVEPRFAQSNFHVDVWNNLGDNVDLAYRLANAGYQVVLTNVTNFYFDLAYNESFYEIGQYWGGYVDVDKAFRFIPFDYYRSLEKPAVGERLTAVGRANIVGLQAPLWSEIITSPERMEYLLLPKLFGLAERAWAADPIWAAAADDATAQQSYAADWSAFIHVLAKQELPRLDYYRGGYHYRIPTTGVVEKEGRLHANVQYPGFTIRYTTDGSEPDAQSPIYTTPLPAAGSTAFRVFNAAGRGGRTIYWQ
ncbi:family 20 glycosylhydrolase [Parapedobacter deserti]|uniref:beta-N-acetylhexosaminidase n=2 Tax=Parapedobacter deserti TaxID=1912957 RepID=A0ABV7JQ15_9SPHI